MSSLDTCGLWIKFDSPAQCLPMKKYNNNSPFILFKYKIISHPEKWCNESGIKVLGGIINLTNNSSTC